MSYRPLRTTRPANLQQARPGWYRVRAQASGPARVDIYDEIGFLAVSADSFIRDLAAISGDIEMHINSPGGDVFDGIAIYNNLRQRAGRVSVVVDGLAASAASFIAQAASPGCLAMAPHSQMMIHDGFGMSIGNAADMRVMADLLDKASDNIAGIYADRTGKPAAYWRDKMRGETWFDDHEAVAEGLADHVLGQEQPRDAWDLSVYLNAPALVNADGNHAPMTGTHTHSHPDGSGGDHRHEHAHDGDAAHTSHDHAEPDGDEAGQPPMVTGRLRNADMHGDHERIDPDGDGDCDACPEGDTDHDYWSEDGEQLRPLPANKGAAGIFNADKYDADDRKRMAANGHAMPDGSYPIEDEEDLDNAIKAVGRGGADHDAIRRHVIKRAKALGKSDAIPDNWNADGSLKSSADNRAEQEFLAIVAGELDQLDAGRS